MGRVAQLPSLLASGQLLLDTLGGHRIIIFSKPMRSPNRRHEIASLYKYLSAETAITVLNSQALRYSSPLLFKDPFDVPRELTSFTGDQYAEAVVEQFRTYLHGEEQPKNQAALTLIDAYRKSGRTDPEQFLRELRFFCGLMVPELSRHLSDFATAYRELIPGKRILCFSRIPDSATMWDHYGQGHSGVVLEFETSDDRDSVWLMAQPVIYQDTKPQVPGPKEWVKALMTETPFDWDEYFREYYLVKHTDWSFEREVRVVTAKKATESEEFADYVFHPDDLRAVILGAKIHEETERVVRLLLRAKYPHAALLRARIDHSERRIAIEPAT